MSNKVKIELNGAGVGDLLKSSELQSYCREKANEIAGRAAGKWEVRTGIGRFRAFAAVSTQDRETYVQNLRNNTLLKAMGGKL